MWVFLLLDKQAVAVGHYCFIRVLMWHLWAALGSHCHPNVLEDIAGPQHVLWEPLQKDLFSCREHCLGKHSLQLSSPSAKASAADSFLVQGHALPPLATESSEGVTVKAFGINTVQGNSEGP